MTIRERPPTITKRCPKCGQFNEFLPRVNGAGHYSYRKQCTPCFNEERRLRYHERKTTPPPLLKYEKMTLKVLEYIEENSPCSMSEITKGTGVPYENIPGRLMAIENGGTLLWEECGMVGIFRKLDIDEWIKETT